MSDLFWLTEVQMVRLRPFFPESHAALASMIGRLERHYLHQPMASRWSDAPREYGPAKTLYNRWKRSSDIEVFARIMAGLAAEGPDHRDDHDQHNYLKAHRTASSLRLKKGGVAG